MKYSIKNNDMIMILDGLELLSWIIRTRQLFGLSTNYEYGEEGVYRLYKKLENAEIQYSNNET